MGEFVWDACRRRPTARHALTTLTSRASDCAAARGVCTHSRVRRRLDKLSDRRDQAPAPAVGFRQRDGAVQRLWNYSVVERLRACAVDINAASVDVAAAEHEATHSGPTLMCCATRRRASAAQQRSPRDPVRYGIPWVRRLSRLPPPRSAERSASRSRCSRRMRSARRIHEADFIPRLSRSRDQNFGNHQLNVSRRPSLTSQYVAPAGFEPATKRLEGTCSIHLS